MSKRNTIVKDEFHAERQATRGDLPQQINQSPFIGWPNFDVFWHQVVKGRTSPAIKAACKEHLKAIGVWEDQSKWIDGLMHFGIPLEQ